MTTRKTKHIGIVLSTDFAALSFLERLILFCQASVAFRPRWRGVTADKRSTMSVNMVVVVELLFFLAYPKSRAEDTAGASPRTCSLDLLASTNCEPIFRRRNAHAGDQRACSRQGSSLGSQDFRPRSQKKHWTWSPVPRWIAKGETLRKNQEFIKHLPLPM